MLFYYYFFVVYFYFLFNRAEADTRDTRDRAQNTDREQMQFAMS